MLGYHWIFLRFKDEFIELEQQGIWATYIGCVSAKVSLALKDCLVRGKLQVHVEEQVMYIPRTTYKGKGNG